MNIKLDGKTFEIKPISQLSFKEFNDFIVKGKASTLPEYFAILTDKPVEEVMESELQASSATFIHQSIFDVNIEKELKEKKSTVKIGDEIHKMDELSLKSFGKSYFFDLYLQQFIEKKINEYDLALYTLAIALSEELNNKIEEIYIDLSKSNWRKVLPQAFFLAEKFKKRKPILIKILKASIWELRRTTSKTRIYLHHLRSMEKNSIRNYSAKDLMYRLNS